MSTTPSNDDNKHQDPKAMIIDDVKCKETATSIDLQSTMLVGDVKSVSGSSSDEHQDHNAMEVDDGKSNEKRNSTQEKALIFKLMSTTFGGVFDKTLATIAATQPDEYIASDASDSFSDSSDSSNESSCNSPNDSGHKYGTYTKYEFHVFPNQVLPPHHSQSVKCMRPYEVDVLGKKVYHMCENGPRLLVRPNVIMGKKMTFPEAFDAASCLNDQPEEELAKIFASRIEHKLKVVDEKKRTYYLFDNTALYSRETKVPV
jgi:hypothetical protein